MIRKLENRQVELLQILKEAEDFLPVHVIAEKMGVSTKTVYRDIEKIVENVKEVKLLKKQGSGIKILFSNFQQILIFFYAFSYLVSIYSETSLI